MIVLDNYTNVKLNDVHFENSDDMFTISYMKHININNLQLFNKNNEKLSLITLEI